jgi:hypothetical protein
MSASTYSHTVGTIVVRMFYGGGPPNYGFPGRDGGQALIQRMEGAAGRVSFGNEESRGKVQSVHSSEWVHHHLGFFLCTS